MGVINIGGVVVLTAWIGSIAFLAVAILYVLLALGLPYGEFAMGGKYKIMPKQMRVSCLISVFIQLVAIMFILQVGHIISISLIESIAYQKFNRVKLKKYSYTIDKEQGIINLKFIY